MAVRERIQTNAPKPRAAAAKVEQTQPPKPRFPRPPAPAYPGNATPAPRAALTLVVPVRKPEPAAPQPTPPKIAIPAVALQIVPPMPKADGKPGMGPPAAQAPVVPTLTMEAAPKAGTKHAAALLAPDAQAKASPAAKEPATPAPKPGTAPATPAGPAATAEPSTGAPADKAEKPDAKTPTESKEAEAPVKGKGEAKAGEARKGKPGEADEGGGREAKSTRGGPGAVRLKMPEPPSSPSPATQKRIAGVKTNLGAAASTHTALPTAAQSTADARGAVDQPPEEANAKAQENLVAALDEKPAPSPEIEEICKKIKEVIKSKRPPDEDSLVKADPKDMAKAASGEVKGGVEGESKKVETGYTGINQDPKGAPAQGQAMTPPPASVDSPPVSATQATPDAVPAQNVSLKADAADSKKSMDDAGMNKPTAQLVKSGPIADARAAQGELDQKAEQGPAEVLAKQKEVLGKAHGDMAALQQQALAGLTSRRKSTVEGTTGQQKGMVLSEEQQRTKASTDAHNIFTDAQTKVDALLKDVTPKALAMWDAKIDILNNEFKQHLKKVADWIADRHSGVGGSILGAWDYFTGLPGWVTDEYDAAEKKYGDDVCALAREISVQVNTVILACEAIIKQARKDISDIFSRLPASLRAWAEGEQSKLGEQLDSLHKKAEQTRTDFNKEIVNRASQAVQDVREQIHALREAAKGLIGKIADAINRFLDDPIKFIIDGLLELVGIPPASFWALIDKIRQVISDIADDPEKFANNFFKGLSMGFSQFFDNFGEHLKKGFLDWLLAGIAAAGINLPKDFSLKSIITFFLELMGITWPNIRKILAKHIGEKNIALIEKVVSLMSTLMELGPSGVFELIKEKLNPAEILKQVVQMAVDYLIEALVKQAVARIVALFNPVGAIFQALEAIYRVLKWVFHNAARIFKLIETVVNGIADIIAGNLGGFANAVEKGLAMMIAPVIDFIADYLGLGDLPAKVKEKIEEFQQFVLGYVEEAIIFLIEKGKAVLAALGIGGKKEKAGDKSVRGEVLTALMQEIKDEHSLEKIQDSVNKIQSEFEPRGLKRIEIGPANEDGTHAISIEASEFKPEVLLELAKERPIVTLAATIRFHSPQTMALKTRPTAVAAPGSPDQYLYADIQQAGVTVVSPTPRQRPPTGIAAPEVVTSDSLQVVSYNTPDNPGGHAEKNFVEWLTSKFRRQFDQFASIEIHLTKSPCAVCSIETLSDLGEKITGAAGTPGASLLVHYETPYVAKGRRGYAMSTTIEDLDILQKNHWKVTGDEPVTMTRAQREIYDREHLRARIIGQSSL